MTLALKYAHAIMMLFLTTLLRQRMGPFISLIGNIAV